MFAIGHLHLKLEHINDQNIAELSFEASIDYAIVYQLQFNERGPFSYKKIAKPFRIELS